MNEKLIKRIDEQLVGFSLPCMESTDMAILLKDCRAALSQMEPVRYVPMTEKQRAQWWSSDLSNGVMLWKFERAVIRLAIAQGAKLEVME